MRLINFYPSHGSYSPGEIISLMVELEAAEEEHIHLQVTISHLAETSEHLSRAHVTRIGMQTINIPWTPPDDSAGYAAELLVETEDGRTIGRTSTAFDVLKSWTDFPRYGFLCDFGSDRSDPDQTLKDLAGFHINGLQFYDWQYRHDCLVAPEDEYVDPLGRRLSLKIIRTLVDRAHSRGIAALPYLAVYAASAQFWKNHKEWALYDNKGEPIPFGENFLGLMDPSPASPWVEHLLSEADKALTAVPFDGLHIDQYGEPKQVWNASLEPVDLPHAFTEFIRSARRQFPKRTILFNAVANWPIDALARSPLDFMYIEIWPPDVEYRDLARIVLNAVRLSNGKPAVIALYLAADHLANILLADALILACGGMRIELGEDLRLLVDPYFPKYGQIAPELLAQLKSMYDFAVRCGEWLSAYKLNSAEEKAEWAEGSLNSDSIKMPDFIWSVVRKHSNNTVISLINFNGLDSILKWNTPHPAPKPCEKIRVQIEGTKRPHQVLWSCPELTGAPQMLAFEYADGVLTFTIPNLHYLGLVFIHE